MFLLIIVILYTCWWLFWILDILRYMLICDLVYFEFGYTLNFLDILLVDIMYIQFLHTCATNCFSWGLFAWFVIPRLWVWLGKWVALYEWVGLSCTHLCCKGFCPRITKEGDYACLARLTIPIKIPKCLLTQFFQSFFGLLAQWRSSCWICQETMVCSWGWSWMELNQPYYLNVVLLKIFFKELGRFKKHFFLLSVQNVLFKDRSSFRSNRSNLHFFYEILSFGSRVSSI